MSPAGDSWQDRAMPKAKPKTKTKPMPKPAQPKVKDRRDFAQTAFDVFKQATDIKPPRRSYEIRRKR